VITNEYELKRIFTNGSGDLSFLHELYNIESLCLKRGGVILLKTKPAE